MPDLADLFPDFATHWIDTDEGRFFVRSGGKGPPLLLLHGYPQTHVEWHRIASQLAAHFTVIMMDLRGYGWSSLPASRDGNGMTKRAMGRDAVAVMQTLGHIKFRLVGHDRGGRVAYRLAFDQPHRLERFATIDIIPTASMFRGLGNTESALSKYHWLFLAQPSPFPEKMIGNAPVFFLEHTLASWTAAKDLSAFDPRALDHYRQAFDDPSRIHSTCECYRAGAMIDRLQDEEDTGAGRKIDVPMLAMWGDAGLASAGVTPLDVWRDFARHVEGAPLPCGHFVPEEKPEECAAALLKFLL